MAELDKKNMPFVEPFETDCDPCLAPECGHTKRCIKKLQAELEKEQWILASEELPKLFNGIRYPHSEDVYICSAIGTVLIGWYDGQGWRTGDGTREIEVIYWKLIIRPKQVLKGK